MHLRLLASFPRTLSTIALALTLPQQASGELYKCEQPSGRIVYQQTACGGHADVPSFEVDIRGPDGSETGSASKDYSVGAQAAEMRAERERITKARLKARAQALAAARRGQGSSSPRADKAKCAKHRAETARWKEEVMRGYKKRTEKDYNENKLAYHQAQVERYCD